MTNVQQNIQVLTTLEVVTTTAKFGMRVQTWDSVPHAKFCKYCLTFGSNIYQKLRILVIFGAVSPHF